MDVRGAVWLPEHMARGSMVRNLPRQPTGKPQQYQTFALLRPRGSHFRPATCQEFECDEFIEGFVFSCDTSTDLGQRQFHYITHDKSRSYSMQRVGQYLFKFVYGPGNDGFAHEHVLPLHRPPKAIVFGGDWRAQTSEARVHTSVENWTDEHWNHNDKLATIRQRG